MMVKMVAAEMEELVKMVVAEMEMIPMIIRTGVHQLNFTLIAGVGEGAAVFGRLQVPFPSPLVRSKYFCTLKI